MSGPIAIEIHINVFETWPFLKDPEESAVIIQSGLSISVFPSLCHMLAFFHSLPEHRSRMCW